MPANQIIFRDGMRSASGAALVNSVTRIIETACRSNDRSVMLEALLRAGELECAISDCGSPGEAGAALLTDVLAASSLGNLPSAAIDQQVLVREIAHSVPPEIRTSPLEGFAFYALHPLDFADACSESASTDAVAVVGIRSIGSVLSAVAKAALCRQGKTASRITVRPSGHPYDRRTSFAKSQEAWIAEQARRGADFLVLDEGPGLSGSSFLSVAEELVKSGVPASRITLLGTRDPDPNKLRARDAAVRWKQFTWKQVGSRLSRRFSEFIPLNGGAWRSLFCEPDAWPACWPAMERLKYLSPDRRWLLKFDGFAQFGEQVRERANLICQAGFGPEAANAGEGMTAYKFIAGIPLDSSTVSREILDRIANYCAFRLDNFGTAQQTDNLLGEMAEFNFSEEFGHALRFPAGILQTGRPVVTDGHMQPHEWIRNTHGTVFKVDACTHGDDHFLPGPTDIAWDLAGTIVEWDLNGDVEHYLITRFRQRTGDDVSTRLAYFVLAYSIFRMAYCKMAMLATEHLPEQLRLKNRYLWYRQQTSKCQRQLREPPAWCCLKLRQPR